MEDMMTNIPTDRPLTAGDDWIEWHGGENPVPGTWVEVSHRGRIMGFKVGWGTADNMKWTHNGSNEDIIAYRLARPATSAASEVEVFDPRYEVDVIYEIWRGDSLEASADSLVEARRYEGQYQPCSLLKATTYRHPVDLPDHPALASPPSERERELEGALDLCSAALQRLHTDIEALMADSEGVSGLHHNGDVATWDDLGQGGQFSDWLGDPLWAARNAWHDARRVLTAQPAGEPTHG